MAQLQRDFASPDQDLKATAFHWAQGATGKKVCRGHGSFSKKSTLFIYCNSIIFDTLQSILPSLPSPKLPILVILADEAR